MPQWKITRLVGAGLSAAYLFYLLFGLSLGVWTCECFGGNSPIYYALTFDLFALAVMLSSLWLSSSKPIGLGDAKFYFSLIVLVIGLGLGTNYLLIDHSLSFDIGIPESYDSSKKAETNGKWNGQLTLRNNTQSTCQIVGLTDNCQFRNFSTLPISLPPGGSVKLDVIIRRPKSKHREKFTSGRASLFVQLDSSSKGMYKVVIPWGVFSF